MTPRSSRWKLVAGALAAAALLAAAGAMRWARLDRARTHPGGVPSPGSASKLSRPDVLLVTIDTLRADAPGFAGKGLAQTPTLDRLAKQGLVFTDAHAQNVLTLPSHTNILTGLYPYQHGVRENAGFRLPESVPTLATLLQAHGYATGAFVGAYPLDRRFGLTHGFDVYDDRYPREKTQLEFQMSERPASEVVSAATAWYRQHQDRPRFLWVHVYDCHAPYRPTAPFADQYPGRPYYGEVAAVDAALAPLLNPFLDGGSRPTLIVLTSDHGEALGQHGEDTHSLFAYEETLKVPLVVWFPGRARPGVDARSARHVDIAPTVAAVAGVPPEKPWPGSSLLAAPPEGSQAESYFEAFSAAYNYGWAPLRGVVAGGFKFIDLPIPELYDLEADPTEQKNLFQSRGDLARRLRARIPDASALDAGARSRPDSEEAARLRSLGYLSGQASAKKTYTARDDPKTLVGVDRDMHHYQELYQGGQLAEATALARKVVAQNPTMFLPYVHLAFLLRRGNAPAAALDVYRAAVARGIANEELATHYGLALCEVGRAREAVALLRPYAESPEPNTLNALGIAFSDAGDAVEAQKTFARALKADPGNLEAHENLGIVRLRAEDVSGAAEWFRRALAIDDRSARAWNGLGVCQARLGDSAGARTSWSKAVELEPTMYDALYNLGLAAAKDGSSQQAHEALERFIAEAPRTAYAGDIEKAKAVLKSLPPPVTR